MSSQLQRAVEVMDRLRSPGGCPWDAEQTHESLTQYLLEETYEVLDAIEHNDLALLREELGDLLLQVLFHARLTQELPAGEAFGIEDVAGDLADKLIRRHPHVFVKDSWRPEHGTEGSWRPEHRPVDAESAPSVHELNETWERQKISEKGRTSAVDGVPLAQPALALSAKLLARANRAGLDVDPASGDDIGERLFAVVRDAVAAGVDPEGALRHTARAYRAAIVAAESR